MNEKIIYFDLKLSQKTNELLTNLADRMQVSKADVLRKAIVLIEIALDAKEKGLKFGAVESDQILITEIVGL